MSSSKGRRNYFSKELLALKLLGVSFSGNESLPYKMYTFLVLPPTVFLYPFLEFYEYFKHDASIIKDLIIYQLATFLALCKTIVVLRNRVKIRKLLDKLEREPFIPNLDRGGQVEEELVAECVRVTGAQTLFYLGFTCLIVISAVSYSIVRRATSNDYHDWVMPYGPLTLFNVTYSPSFEINLLYQAFSDTLLAGLFISIDLLLSAVLVHISYQFKILQNAIRRMVERGQKNMMKVTNGLQHKSSNESFIEISGSDIPWEYLRKPIIEAVEYHVAIINVAKEIDAVFSDLLLFEFLGTLVLLCFSTYTASSAQNYQSAVKHMVEGILCCLQVAAVCFWGEQVFQESQLVGKAAYESNFAGTDLRFQKMLVLIIRKSQNPIKITAGKFTDICLSTFAWILRTSYSSFMILRRSNV